VWHLFVHPTRFPYSSYSKIPGTAGIVSGTYLSEDFSEFLQQHHILNQVLSLATKEMKI
jgi:hypothetical protein